jgi:hypothetical protein
MDQREGIAGLSSTARYLYEANPGYDEFDVREIVEEKSGRGVSDEDFQTLKAIYVRVQLGRTGGEKGVRSSFEGWVS